MTVISDKYSALGGPAGVLGAPTTEESLQPDGRSHYRLYADGAIYTSWTPAPSSTADPMSVELAHEVHGTIYKKWKALGADKSVLGLVTTDQRSTSTGEHYNRFQHGSIYTHHTPYPTKPDEPLSVEVANEVHGLIHEKWRALGFEAGPLSYPTTDERPMSDGAGRYNRFFPSGIIARGPASGPQAIYGSIYAKYVELGGIDFCGYPVSDEYQDALFPWGRRSDFQNCVIFYSLSTGAHELHGSIWARYRTARSEASFVEGYSTIGQHLGLPTTDELGTPDGIGRFNHFERGSIYYTLTTGAWEILDIIRDKWASLGWEKGFLGYPISEEGKVTDGTRAQSFQGGWIVWSATTGVHEVHGAIREAWASDVGPFGMPVSDELAYGTDGGRVSNFEKGSIYWTPWSGVSINKPPPPKPGTPTPPPGSSAAKQTISLAAKHKDDVGEVKVWTYEGTFPASVLTKVEYITAIGAFSTSPLYPFEIRFFKNGKGESDASDPSATVPMKNTESLGPDKIALLTGGDAKPKSITLLAMSNLAAADHLNLVISFVGKVS